MAENPPLVKDDLVRGFRSVGLEAGQHVVVHSSLGCFGRHMPNGAHDVIDALEEIITPDGTLLMPTFSGRVPCFLEGLALARGINGDGGTGRGVVFEGTADELYGEATLVAESFGFTAFPFPSPEAFVERIAIEGIGRQPGWSITPDALPPPGGTIRIARDAPPLAAEDVKPWRMPVTTGIIPETFWRRPETYRSHQYSGSFGGWGRLTREALGDHDNREGQQPEEHPLWRMKEAGGKVLLLGIDHGRNSTLHVLQAHAKIRSARPYPDDWPEEFLGHFMNIEEPLDRVTGQTKGMIGEAPVRLADTRTMYDVVANILERKLDAGSVQ